MKNLQYFLLVAIFFSTTISYSQSAGKLMKMGKTFEANGSYKQASEYYFRCLEKKPDKTKALLGLDRTSKKVINKILVDAISAFNDKQYQMVINNYESAIKFKNKVKKYVDINIPLENIKDYNKSKSILAEQYYLTGTNNFNKKNYKKAITDLEKCLGYQPNYKDATKFLNLAKNAQNLIDAENSYKIGVSKMNAKNYKDAYYSFSSCLGYINNYKDAQELRSEALKKGIIKIAVFNFKNNTNFYGIDKDLNSYIITDIKEHNSPFIKVISGENLNNLLKRNGLSLSDIVDVESAAQVGQVIDVNYIVTGQIISVSKDGGGITSKKVNCYKLTPYKTSDGKNFYRGNPTSFNVYEGAIKITANVKYQIIDSKSGRILEDKTFSSGKSDHVKYATYRGDPSKLCAINPDGTLAMQLLAVASMINQDLFHERSHLNSFDDLKKPILRDLAFDISDGITDKLD